MENKNLLNNKWIIAGFFIVLITSAIFICRRGLEKAAMADRAQIIAILPFSNPGPDSSNDYLCEGMTDELIVRLSKISGLQVIARNSVMKFKGNETIIKHVADSLKISAVVTGSITKSGNQFLIRSSLIDAGSGNLIWEENFSRDTSEIFSIQREVAERVAARLNRQISAAEKEEISRVTTQNLQAYDQYLKGRYYWYKGGEKMLRKAIRFFSQAIQLDSQYALAYSGLADCYSSLGYNSYELPAAAFTKAEQAANKALELDSNLADPHTSLGYIKFYYYWDWHGAEQEFLEAIRLNPVYVLAYDSYGYYLTAMERFPEARAAFEKAALLDPLSVKINTDLGFNLYYEKAYGPAIAALKYATEIYDSFPLTHLWMGRTYQEKKMNKDAITEYKKAMIPDKTWPVGLAALGYIYGIDGEKQEAKKILDTMLAVSRIRYVTPYGLALVYLALNEKDNALQCLDQAYNERSNWLVWLKQDPRWIPLSDDHRYRELMEKIGLPRKYEPFSRQ